jgi:hypothetical protein
MEEISTENEEVSMEGGREKDTNNTEGVRDDTQKEPEGAEDEGANDQPPAYQTQCIVIAAQSFERKITQHNKPFLRENQSKNNSTTATTTLSTTSPLSMILNNDNTDNNNKQTFIYATNRMSETNHSRAKRRLESHDKRDTLIESEMKIAENPDMQDIIATTHNANSTYCENARKRARQQLEGGWYILREMKISWCVLLKSIQWKRLRR